MNPPVIHAKAAAMVAVLAGLYVAAQMLADIGSLRITEVFGYAVDAGTLIYPITFTLRDVIHKAAGAYVARAVIFTAAAVNLFMAGYFWLVGELPSIAGVGPQSEMFGDVLSPVWRIVWASIIAEVIAQLIDTEVYRVWVRRYGERMQWGRVLSSNAVAIPIDSIIFAFIAFAGVVTGAELWEIIWVNIVFKLAVTVVSIPLIYLVQPARVVDDPDQPLPVATG
jgi:uncharacterized integral membrane protein (TIGR00697 family)